MHIITIIRNYLGLTQHELACMAGITQADLCEIETKPPYSSIEKYKRLSKALDIPVQTLVYNDYTGVPDGFFEKHSVASYHDYTNGMAREGEAGQMTALDKSCKIMAPRRCHMITKTEIENFKNYLYENEKSSATIEKYIHAVEGLVEFLGGRDLSKSRVLEYRAYLLASHRAQTVNGYLSAVNTFLSFIGCEDCRVRLLKIQRRAFLDESRELTKEEYRRLLQAARQKGDERLCLMMQTLCATGIRVSELQYITVKAAQCGVTEIALKGKIRTILLPRELCRKLLQYARKEKITSGEVFLTKGGHGISRKQVWAEMKALCAAADVDPKKVFPHNLRHIFARAFYRVCRDISKLADVLGHSSIETTRIYIMSTGAEHVDIMRKMQLLC